MTDKSSETGARELSFETDRGASRSFWIATAVLLAVIGWMASGFILPSAEPEAAPAEAEVRLASVSVTASAAKPVTLTFSAEGQALPDRDTMIRAESSGDVGELLVRKGQNVARGAVIATLTTAQLDADLTRAREELAVAQREYDNASALLQRGVATADRVSSARASLAAAEAQVTAAEEALRNARIVAPFAGRIETLSLDEGEFVTSGAEVGRIVDNRPLTVEIQVPQQALNRVKTGQTARVTFITGETLEGEVTFVGTAAASSTRTFLAEITVENADGRIPAGISAQIVIPTGEATAHFLAPSSVSLSEDGELGVKVVEDGKVAFRPIEIVKADLNGVWATGLPETAEVITIGQGYVRDGESVTVQPAPSGAGETEAEGAVAAATEPDPEASAEPATGSGADAVTPEADTPEAKPDAEPAGTAPEADTPEAEPGAATPAPQADPQGGDAADTPAEAGE
ncbi:efflux RND transporter periplasmic adaptor subunit [Ponticoccus sp. (in: a-proteobacteria)]|uniref:efflux RND transporter periplasmic adaptor subunit n=1 Tax=Ponticoccus sp. (in: a-proteobacteria) TaxID=1925025 RepID=UPI003AB5CFC2